MCKVFDAGKCVTRGGPWTLIRYFFWAKCNERSELLLLESYYGAVGKALAFEFEGPGFDSGSEVIFA